MAAQPLPAWWAGHLRVWHGFVDSLRELHLQVASEILATYLDPQGPRTWGDPAGSESWRVGAFACLGSPPVSTGISVDFYDKRLAVDGWGSESTSVKIRLSAPSPDMFDEALGYTAALIGLLPDLDGRCQPIGCDAGIHLPGCRFAEVDAA